MNAPQIIGLLFLVSALGLTIGLFYPRKLVQFDDGKFGIRKKWWFGWHFKDIYYPDHSDKKRNHKDFDKYCKNDLSTASKFLTKPQIKYTVLSGAKLKDVKESEYENSRR